MDDKLRSVLEFSKHIIEVLDRYQNSLPEPCPDVVPYTNVLPFPPSGVPKPQRLVLRDHGVKIWNHCSIASAASSACDQGTLAKLKMFAYLLLASGTPQKMKRPAPVLDLFKYALMVARICLNAAIFDLADKVMQNEAALSILTDEMQDIPEHTGIRSSCLIEYYCLRILLDWKRKRSDLADFWYKSVTELNIQLQDSDVEKAVDLFYEIGRESLSNGTGSDNESAAKWLERALVMLNRQENVHAFASSELRFNVMHSLVQALSRLSGCEHQARTGDLLKQLTSEYGTKLPVLLLNLEVMCANAEFGLDQAQYAVQLQEIIRSAHIIDANHNLIMHYINWLEGVDRTLALQCIRTYILQRLIHEREEDWNEQAIVNYISLISHEEMAASTDDLQLLEKDLTTFVKKRKSCLSPFAAQASHVLIWKRIREIDATGSRSTAMLWCQIGLHCIFEAVGENNNGKLQRQLICYHLLVSNVALAQQLLEQMSFTQRNNRTSRYLAYCVAIRSGDETNAQSCLNTIANGSGENGQLLLACIGETIKHGKALDTARLLQRLIDKHSQNILLDIQFGALLQYTTKTLLQVIASWDSNVSPDEEVLTRLCCIFKRVARLDTKHNPETDRKLSNKVDRDWFEQLAFELAKDHINSWPRRYVIDLLDYSCRLCESRNVPSDEIDCDEKRKERLQESLFLKAALYVAEARNASANFTVEDMPESSYNNRSKPTSSECRLVLYRNAFLTFTNIQERCKSGQDGKENSMPSIGMHLHVLMPVAFEALLFMNASSHILDGTAFDEVSIKQFLIVANDFKTPPASYALLADVVLTFACGDTKLGNVRIPYIAAARTLGSIVQKLRKTRTYNLQQAARWIRCIAQLIFEDIESNISNASESTEWSKTEQNLNMLNSVLDEALSLSGQTSETSTNDPNDPNDSTISRESKSLNCEEYERYPAEELQWLSTKLWNMSIDLCRASQTEMAKTWASKAVQVAEMVTDDSRNVLGLAAHLKNHIRSLGWDTIAGDCE